MRARCSPLRAEVSLKRPRFQPPQSATAGRGEGSDPADDVDRHPADVVGEQLDLAGMYPAAKTEANALSMAAISTQQAGHRVSIGLRSNGVAESAELPDRVAAEGCHEFDQD